MCFHKLYEVFAFARSPGWIHRLDPPNIHIEIYDICQLFTCFGTIAIGVCVNIQVSYAFMHRFVGAHIYKGRILQCSSSRILKF
jgi:hypothetical protein